MRKTNELEAVRWRDEIVKVAGRTKREIHFTNLNHSQKIAACQSLAARPIRLCHVLIAKAAIATPHLGQKNWLYFYALRFLIERLSWLCRDLRPSVPEGNGRLAITFSRRGGMSYPEFRRYLLLLQGQTEENSIHWPVIDTDALNAQDHSRLAALQLADIAASAFAAAMEADRYGNQESRYASILRPVTYSHDGERLGYGLKLMPSETSLQLTPQQLQFLDLFRKERQPPGP